MRAKNISKSDYSRTRSRARNYEAANREVVREQLAKAGFRLANLLDAIYR